MVYDPVMERRIKVTDIITESLEHPQEMFDELKNEATTSYLVIFPQQLQTVSAINDLQPSTSLCKD